MKMSMLSFTTTKKHKHWVFHMLRFPGSWSHSGERTGIYRHTEHIYKSGIMLIFTFPKEECHAGRKETRIIQSALPPHPDSTAAT